MEQKNYIVAGIVLKSRFIQSSEDVFEGYIDYINRSEAVRNDNLKKYSLYNDYMSNPEKTTALFTADNDMLTDEQKLNLKSIFQNAQKSGSLMWQNVISFDNRWLAKHNLYDADDNTVDEYKLREVTREVMNAMAIKEQMSESLVWSAAIHYNTDNLHIHIAAVEPIPSRTRGKLKLQTLEQMKSKTFSTILDRTKEHTAITELVREKILNDKNNHKSIKNAEMRKQFLHIYKLLPENKNLWNYNMNAIKEILPEIDKLTDIYIKNYHKNDFEELKNKLSTEENLLKEAFGTGEQELYKDYSKNRIKDLYTRMGNTILKELKKYDYEKNISKITKYFSKNQKSKLSSVKRNDSIVYNLKKALKTDFNSIKNQRYFNALIQTMEMEN